MELTVAANLDGAGLERGKLTEAACWILLTRHR